MRKSAKFHARGFSILELVLAATFVLSIAAIALPSGSAKAEVREQSMATEHCRSIGKALYYYQSDTGMAPTGFRGKTSFGWLRGYGRKPQFSRQPAGEAGDLAWFLRANKMGAGEQWAGPYLDRIPVDPWGRRYIAYVRPMLLASDGSANKTWILSAGPNGVIDTRPEDSVLAADDLGITCD